MTTLTEIARTAGVSLTVASRALSNDEVQQNRVSAKALKHVREVARRMGYCRNRAAEFLKRGQNPVIGVFLPPYEDCLIARLQKGLCIEANKQDFPVSFQYEMSYESYREFLTKASIARRCGIITYPYFNGSEKCEKLLQDYLEKGGKIISISPSTVLPWIPTFLVDNHAGGTLAGERLAACGCETIVAYVSIPERAAGCGKVAEKFGIRFFSFFTDQLTPERFFQELNEIIRSGGKTGIFAGSDRVAMQLCNFLHERKWRVGPDSIPVIGYDNQDFSQWLDPPLTTIDQPFEELGRLAMSRLLDSIYQRQVKSLTLAPNLIIRKSA